MKKPMLILGLVGLLGGGALLLSKPKKKPSKRAIIIADVEGEDLLQLDGARRLTAVELGESVEDVAGLDDAVVVLRVGVEPWTGANPEPVDEIIADVRESVVAMIERGNRIVFVPSILPWAGAYADDPVLRDRLAVIQRGAQMFDTWAKAATGDPTTAPEVEPLFHAVVDVDAMKGNDGQILSNYVNGGKLNQAGRAELTRLVKAAVAKAAA